MPISEQLLDDIKNHKIIDSIDFCNQNLNDKDIEKLAAALKYNTDIKNYIWIIKILLMKGS